jgi:hypothetical protein
MVEIVPLQARTEGDGATIPELGMAFSAPRFPGYARARRAYYRAEPRPRGDTSSARGCGRTWPQPADPVHGPSDIREWNNRF